MNSIPMGLDVPFIIQQANGSQQDTVVNATAGSIKFKSTTEGILLAYGSLVIMALIPVVVGSYKSIAYHQKQKKMSEKSGEAPETMTSKDAMMFPVIASCALFGLYVLFRVFSKEYINYLMTGYFVILGAMAITHLLAPVLRKLTPNSVKSVSIKSTLRLSLTKESKKEEPKNEANQGNESEARRSSISHLINFKFDSFDVAGLIVSLILAVWYLMKKHWVANNLFGMAFAINGVELLHLNSVATGCILLSGLFFYDIFWVFYTEVMVTVAKSFDAPIKLVFPQDFLEKGFYGTQFAMLGLGDIVIPGIFIALLLRFDRSLNRQSNSYFNASFAAYIVGMLICLVIMSIFKHAQPVLLYLVPACISFPVILAVIKGDLKKMFAYEDHSPQKQEEAEKKQE